MESTEHWNLKRYVLGECLRERTPDGASCCRCLRTTNAISKCCNFAQNHRLRINRSAIRWTLLLFALTSSVTFGAQVAPPSWEAKPVDSDVRLSSNVTLSCAVRTAARPGIQWSRYDPDGRTVHLFVNASNWNAPANYRVVAHRYGYDLVVEAAMRVDDGLFECSVQQTTMRANARITVLVPPGEPVISANRSLPSLVEGDYLSLNCSSGGGNPTPLVTWHRNNILVPPTSSHQPDEKFGSTSNALVWRVSRDDHNATFSCSVTNRAVEGEKLTTVERLSVQYKPAIELLPFNPYHILEGHDMVLTCRIHANPPVMAANVFWSVDGQIDDIVGTGFQLRIASVSRQHRGSYRCTAHNTVGENRAELTVDVQYAPELRLRFSAGDVQDNTVTITEHQPINMTCNVDANPAASSGATRWLVQETYVHTGAVYAIARVKRTHAGRYTCETANTMEPSGERSVIGRAAESIELSVMYKPGEATISGVDSVVQGSSAVLKCSVDVPGEPAAELRWTRLGSSRVLYTGATWRLASASLSDNGEYVCTPVNRVGDGQPAVKLLTVNEPVRWLSVPGAPRSVVQLNGSVVPVVCVARGRPAPNLTWLKDGRPLEDGMYREDVGRRRVDTYSWNVSSSLSWTGVLRSPDERSLRMDDNGNYTCVATNSVTEDDVSHTVQLVVQYPPLLNVSADRVAVDINQSALLVCRCRAVPPPVFLWYNGTERLTSAADARVTLTAGDVPGDAYQYVSELHVATVTMTDFGDYRCVARNEVGVAERTVHLAVKTIPDAARHFQLVSKTWESVEFEWVAGFDGGYSQNFSIIYQRTNSSDTTLNSAQVGLHPRFNITHLMPTTSYTFWVIAENLLGHSGFSNRLVEFTQSFLVAVPEAVVYDASSQTLTFRSPSTHLCARVDVYDGRAWRVYEACAPTAGGSLRVEGDIEGVRVALCMERRQDVCSLTVTATAVEDGEDLPVSVIIIVACVCGSIVLILSIILIVLCYRRFKAKKLYEQEAATRAVSSPVLTHTQQPADKPQPVNTNSFENRGLDQIDLDDLRRTNSDPPPAYPALGAYRVRQPTSNPNVYENQQNERNHRHPQPPIDSPDGNMKRSLQDSNRQKRPRGASQSDSKDGHNESGLSGDSHKPKKIVYEVVV